jgi:copper chaperone CopZ
MIKKVFRLDGMHCSNCSMAVESIEDDLPGIKKISASYQKGNMIVEYDESLVTEIQIINAVEKHGYHAEAL